MNSGLKAGSACAGRIEVGRTDTLLVECRAVKAVYVDNIQGSRSSTSFSKEPFRFDGLFRLGACGVVQDATDLVDGNSQSMREHESVTWQHVTSFEFAQSSALSTRTGMDPDCVHQALA